jgi:hypothetical protein
MSVQIRQEYLAAPVDLDDNLDTSESELRRHSGEIGPKGISVGRFIGSRGGGATNQPRLGTNQASWSFVGPMARGPWGLPVTVQA